MSAPKIITVAWNFSSAIIIFSEFSAWATMRRSSSTARTFAAPVRKIAWLSAKMIFSIYLLPLPRFADEFVLINDAGNAVLFLCPAGIGGSRRRCLLAHHAPGATHLDISRCAQHSGWKSDIELDWRTYAEVQIRHDVNTCRAHVGRSAGVIALLAVDLDRQFEGKPFPCS